MALWNFKVVHIGSFRSPEKINDRYIKFGGSSQLDRFDSPIDTIGPLIPFHENVVFVKIAFIRELLRVGNLKMNILNPPGSLR